VERNETVVKLFSTLCNCKEMASAFERKQVP
jgi:hypothetical protein